MPTFDFWDTGFSGYNNKWWRNSKAQQKGANKLTVWFCFINSLHKHTNADIHRLHLVIAYWSTRRVFLLLFYIEYVSVGISTMTVIVLSIVLKVGYRRKKITKKSNLGDYIPSVRSLWVYGGMLKWWLVENTRPAQKK